MGRRLSPRYGQVILVSGTLFGQLSIDYNIDGQYVCYISLPVLPKYLESVGLNIGFHVVRTDGQRAGGRAGGVRSRDYQIFWDG